MMTVSDVNLVRLYKHAILSLATQVIFSWTCMVSHFFIFQLNSQGELFFFLVLVHTTTAFWGL